MQILAAVRAALGMIVVVGLLLLVPAGLADRGTWVWTQAWVFLAISGAVIFASTVALAIWAPESFAVRQQKVVPDKSKKQPRIDRIGLPIYLVYVLAWVVFIPLDVFALRLFPPVNMVVSVAGAVACVAGIGIGQLSVAQNRFAAPTIHDQSAERQQVVDTGLYGVIRHPLYAGNLLTFTGMALWLGSYAAAIAVSVMLAATVARILIEEAYLRENLPGYADYTRRVRSRLIPFVL